MVLTGSTINVAIFLTVISIILCHQWQSCLDVKYLNLDRDDPVQKRIQNPPSRASNMELLAKIVNGWKPFTVFAKSSILDVWLGSEYTSAVKHLWWTFFVKIALCAKKVSKYGVFSGPYFPVFGLNMEIYGVILRIQSEYRKIRTRQNSVLGHFSCSECSCSFFS